MASAAKFLLDEALNKTDIDSSEVSAIVDTLETQLSEQKKNKFNNQINFKDNLNNNNHPNATTIASVTISSEQLTSNGHQEEHRSSEENHIFTANNNISNFVNNNISTKGSFHHFYIK